MNAPIILLSGGTGVGTSRFSLELAKELDISTIVSTDIVREVIRKTISPSINPTFGLSTYMAGQTKNYSKKSHEVKKAEIIRGYKNQCGVILNGVDGVVSRAVKENIPVIIEGIHLIPGKIHESALYELCKGRLIEYTVFIGDAKTHKNRFIEREKNAPERSLSKYINNFKEIRIIHDYIVDRSKRYLDIKMIDNSKDVTSSVKSILDFYYEKQD